MNARRRQASRSVTSGSRSADAVRRFLTDQCPPAVVRLAVDDGERGRPPFHEAMAALGWLGLHLPERAGGQGYGLSEAVIVAEEFARVPAPGPLLSTLVAGALLRIAAATAAVAPATSSLSGDSADDWIERIATGQATVAVANAAGWTADGHRDRTPETSGNRVMVPGADGATAVIVPVPERRADGEIVEDWYLLEADQIEARVIEPLDLTRSIAEVTIESASLTPQRRLEGVDAGLVDAVTATFTAAECAGVASWCVDTAADYAQHRHQFGRPIGAFQAVKHRCADMLVATEATRAVAWDAAAAADAYFAALEVGQGPDEIAAARDGWALAADAAAAVALDAAVKVAEDCIQVLGGIGFTWEHDAHLHLRRAVALRQQLGGSSRWRRHLVDLACNGVQRRLRVDVPPEADGRRDEIRAHAEELAGLDGEEQRAKMVELGYLVPHWPAPWGCDADAVTQLLIDAELRRVKVRRPHLQVGAWAAPTIAAHGTSDQQERWVRPTLLGQITWCQLFSEPEAGSDLAGLRTRARKVDGGWSVTGQKVWTTMATEADWGICLVRTDPDAPKHDGITYLVIDMKSPGIDVRPLREMTGLEMFNEVFFDDVFVPDDCVIGAVNGGWPLARTTLGNERVSMGSGSSFGGGVDNLLRLVRDRWFVASDDGVDGALDPVVADRLGGLIGEAHAVATLGTRATLRSLTGSRPGPESSIRKLLGVEHDQRVQEFGLDLLGPAGAAIEGDAATWTFGFLANRCLTIAGGTSEIQRNVIGERLLGLPRDRSDR